MTSSISPGGLIRVVIADDHAIFRSGLRSELGAQADLIADAIEVRATGDRPGGLFNRGQRRPGS